MSHDLYLSLSDEKTIALYQRHPTSGALSQQQDFPLASGSAPLCTDIAKRHLYQTGAMTTLGQTPTEPMLRAFNIDPEGGYLYTAGLDSGQLASYRILDNGGPRSSGTLRGGRRPDVGFTNRALVY